MVDFKSDDPRWPITTEDRAACVQALMEIVRSDDIPCAIRAARLLMSLDQLNLRWETKASELIQSRIRQLLRERNQ